MRKSLAWNAVSLLRWTKKSQNELPSDVLFGYTRRAKNKTTIKATDK
jgi:hypothetical protein